MGFQVLFGHFKLQSIHRGIRFYGSGIYRLGMATDHAFVYTHAENFRENLFKYSLWIQLTGPAYGGMPR